MASLSREEVLGALKKLRRKDGDYSRILSSVCTRPLRIATQAFAIYHDTNALDKQLFPSLERLEAEVIGWFSKLYGIRLWGYITTGGTEANLAVIYAASRKSVKKELLVPRSAHYSIRRAADMLGLRISWIPLREDFKVDVEKAQEMLSNETLAIIGTAGTPALGVVDPLKELDELAAGVHFHVDAAFGGFVLPFLGFDFSELENVDSLTVDPHKMGLSTIPAGCVLFRSQEFLEALEIEAPYLGFKPSTLSGTRSGGAIAAVWALQQHLGFGGYQRVVRRCFERTLRLYRAVRRLGLDVLKPELNFLAFRLQEQAFAALRRRGWKLTRDEETGYVRVVVMPHLSERVLREFLEDLREVVNSIR